MRDELPQTRAVRVARLDDGAACAAAHQRRVVVQAQIALGRVRPVASEAMLTKDRLDVLFVRDLGLGLVVGLGLVGRGRRGRTDKCEDRQRQRRADHRAVLERTQHESTRK